MDLVEKLHSVISDAGFDAFAIMSADPLQDLLPVLQKARQENRYSPFASTNLEKRIAPRALQKSARSVITLGLNYYWGDPNPPPPLWGTVSRFAWGQDYHRLMAQGMNAIIAYLRKHLGAGECTGAADTSFLADRALAAASGLGSFGKNCSVFVPPFGSWVFLGQILVDLKLPETRGERKKDWSCPPDCRACFQICPTGALVAPGELDSSRCLSYLTQASEPIPSEFREKLGSTLWGCDLCQEVCPRNAKPIKSAHPGFNPLVGPHLPLIPLLSLSNKDFKTQFQTTGIGWRGKNVLQRNACIVLGNQGNPAAKMALEKTVAGHCSETVRDAARWALDRIES